MNLPLNKLKLGKADGRSEYLEPKSDSEKFFFDAFLVPESVEFDRLNNSDIFFVEGFRGTGKTSLLRYFSEDRRKNGSETEFILFKSDIPEDRRAGLSSEIGVSWTDTDSSKMEFSQDFKSAWTWFIHHKIGEILQRTYPDSTERFKSYLSILGLVEEGTYQKVLGFLPKLEGSKTTVRANLGFFEAEFGLNLSKAGEKRSISLETLNRHLIKNLEKYDIGKTIYIFFDELEVFYEARDKYERDQRMVRDLLFAVDQMNTQFRNKSLDIHLVAAVRSEIIDAFGSLGQEIDRIVHDKGVMIAWHFARRSLQHPLVEIIRRKIVASETALNVKELTDPIGRYFPSRINNQYVDAFLLDRTFYKPRDVVWRLTIAQKQFPSETSFSEEILRQSEIEYSAKMWEEIRYELSASYANPEINALEMALSGGSADFDLMSLQRKFSETASYSAAVRKLISNHDIADIVSDLYRLGAVGNRYRAGTSSVDWRQRWAFRGDVGVVLNQQLTIHPSLLKRLSASPSRQRGKPGGRSNRSRDEA